MNTTEPLKPANEPSTAVPAPDPPPLADGWSRRSFLRGAAVAGGGLVAAGIAACTPGGAATWTFGPQMTAHPEAASPSAGAAGPPPSAGSTMDHSSPGTSASAGASASAVATASAPASASALASGSAPPSASTGPIPAGWTEHDIDARNVVRRYIGNLAPALKDIYGDAAFAKLADILGAADDYPELQPEAGLRPGAATGPQRRADASHAADRRRRQGVQPDDRRDRPADRRAQAAGRRRSATTSSGPARRSA